MIKAKIDKGAYTPERAHKTDAGLDLRSPERFILWSHSRKVIDTGVHVEIPEGYAGLLRSKSGLMCDHGILSDGTVDSGYSGSVRVCMINTSNEPYTVKKGDKISQLVVVPSGSCRDRRPDRLRRTRRERIREYREVNNEQHDTVRQVQEDDVCGQSERQRRLVYCED